MKLAAAQTKPIKGNIEENILGHVRLIDAAQRHGAQAIVFPELSLTGYEPTIAKTHATTINDIRFRIFHQLSQKYEMTIGVGIPLYDEQGIYISMVLFTPRDQMQVNTKRYLHTDEEAYFRAGSISNCLTHEGFKAALAICYEISLDHHAEEVIKEDTELYIASVAKSDDAIETSLERLGSIAEKYSIPVLMSNCIGVCDGDNCAGKTSAWNKEGDLVAQLDSHREGFLIYDTDSGHGDAIALTSRN